jgi:hypothetical protein
MNFMQLLKSLDDLLYEVMSWLVFFPLTLWRTLVSPLKMMEYAHSELHNHETQQFDETLSPPMLLLLALLVGHGMELWSGYQDNPIVANQSGMAELVGSDSALIALRMIIFSVVPLALAVSNVKARGDRLTRPRLKEPFYTQCYPGALYAIMVGVSGQLGRLPIPAAPFVELIGMVLTTLGYFGLEIVWFRRHLGLPYLAAVAYVFLCFAAGLAIALMIALLFA